MNKTIITTRVRVILACKKDPNVDSFEENEDSIDNSNVDDEDERELEQHWNQKFDASFSSTVMNGHTRIAFTQASKPVDVFNKFFYRRCD